MQLSDLFDPRDVTYLEEVLDTKIPVSSWSKRGTALVGSLIIDNNNYEIYLQPGEFQQINYIDVAFARLGDNGIASNELFLESQG